LFLWLFTVPNIVVILLELFGIAYLPGFSLYAWGLYWILVPPVVQFLIFVHHFNQPQDPNLAP
jgi:hypothetical protein